MSSCGAPHASTFMPLILQIEVQPPPHSNSRSDKKEVELLFQLEALLLALPKVGMHGSDKRQSNFTFQLLCIPAWCLLSVPASL